MTDPYTSPRASPHPSNPQTDLRDARLHKALAHAPDSDALPATNTRNTIKNIANNVIPTWENAKIDTPMPWWTSWWDMRWKTFWQRSGREGGPWNAAFATVLLGGIITLIWRGHDVPDAVLDERPVVAKSAPSLAKETPAAPSPALADEKSVKAPSVAPVRATPPPSTPSASPAPARLPAPATQAPATPASPAAPAAPAAPTAPTATSADSGAAASPALRRDAPTLEKRESMSAAATAADKSVSAMSDVAPATPPAQRQSAPLPPPAAPAPAPAPAPASAPPTPAPVPAPAAPAPAPTPAPEATGRAGPVAEQIARNDNSNRNRMTMSAPAALQPAEWTLADLLYLGRTTRLGRRDALNLVKRVVALATANAAPVSNVAPSAAPSTAPSAALSADADASFSARANSNADSTANPDRSASAVPKAARDAGALRLRLQLLDQRNPAAVAQFELRGGNNFYWQRAGMPDASGVLTAEAAASLLAEAARALRQ